MQRLAAPAWIILYGTAAPIERLTLGLSQLLFGVGAIWALVSVDLAVHRVNWTLLGTWIWVVGFIALAIAGAVISWHSRWCEA